jgi:hypothetical protein
VPQGKPTNDSDEPDINLDALADDYAEEVLDPELVSAFLRVKKPPTDKNEPEPDSDLHSP